MVTSGSVNTSSYQGRYYQLSWTAKPNVADNTSTISWTLKAVGGTSSWYAERTLKVVIAGETVYSKSDRVERYEGTVKTGEKKVAHNSDGTKSFSISVQAAVFVTNVNCTGSKSFTLDPIARKSTLAVSGGTLGTAQELKITEAESSFKHRLKYFCGTAEGYILGSSSSYSTSNSVSWTAPESLAAQNKTGDTVSIKFTLYTYTNGGDLVGSNSYTKTFAIPGNPSCSISVSDATEKSSTYGGYIKGISKFKVTVTPTLYQGSTIASYSTSANGATYTDATFTTAALNKSGNIEIKAKVTDKRGRSGTATKTINVLDYSPPTVSKLSVNRCNSDGSANSEGEYIKVTYSGSITNLSKNTAKFQLEYKKTTDASYSTPITLSTAFTVTDGTYIFAADTGSSYDVQIVATDAVSPKPTTKSTSASSGFTIMHFNAEGNGMGLGKVCEFDGLDVGFTSRFTKNFMVGRSTLWDDGLEGTKLSPSGGIVIQRASGSSPYLDFRFYGTKNTYDARIICVKETENNTEYNNLKIQGADDVYITPSRANSTSFRPYYRKGDSITVIWTGSGYVSSSSKNIYFTIPLAKPVIGSPAVSVASVGGIRLRQNNSYTHGSSADNYIAPAEYPEPELVAGCFVRITAVMNATTNATNNSATGIQWSGKITFS